MNLLGWLWLCFLEFLICLGKVESSNQFFFFFFWWWNEAADERRELLQSIIKIYCVKDTKIAVVAFLHSRFHGTSYLRLNVTSRSMMLSDKSVSR